SYLPLSDLDPVLDYYTPIVASSESYLGEEPDAARRFLSALARKIGQVDAIGQHNLFAATPRKAAIGADIVVTSELSVTGYPTEDFAQNPSLLKTVRDSVDALARDTASGPALIVGAPWLEGEKLYNTALLLDGGRIVAKVFKHDLPNYGTFDEKRVFTPAPLQNPVAWRGCNLGILICEDMWTEGPAAHLRKAGAQLLCVLNGSPFEAEKQSRRYELARKRVKETEIPLVYVNQTGGHDELVFEGASFVMDARGTLQAQARAWGEDTLLTSFRVTPEGVVPETSSLAVFPEKYAAIYHGLMTGLRDYVKKNGFNQVLLGLSGGIDSALVAALAVDALGSDKVGAIMMPSTYTSKESVEDATDMAKALGCRLDTIPITPLVHAFETALATRFMDCPPDATEENIQSRCRGMVLMALSNKSGAMVLATGNKSEMATGYATLYGDMCGGYAPLKDVYKTEVYPLARWRYANKPENAFGPDGVAFPSSLLTKAPSAELRPHQTDQDSLPPYDVLDEILKCLIEKEEGLAEIVARGHDL
ncbi:MAG: NAD+ synthase, partial [Alphaproteobacteria bacterium]|nr:NAD+ synthase [Alphaproteobacteria bacterium]